MTLNTKGFPPILSGFQRQWTKCKTCGNIAFYDYVPFSLSNPVMVLPCGHSGAQRFYDAAEDITNEEAIQLLAERETITL